MEELKTSRKDKIKLTKELLEQLYIEEDLNQREIADMTGYEVHAVLRKLKKFSIQKSQDKICEKRKQTNIKKYGAANAMQAECIRNKVKETMLERYGVENPSQSEEILAKKKATSLENYGVEHPFQAEEIKEKIKKSIQDKYGVDNVSLSEEIKIKKQNTCLEHYGVENSLLSTEVRDKIKQTNLDKYGVENPFQSEEIKSKIKQTNLEKYGFECSLKSEQVKEKTLKTNMEKYGVSHYMKSVENQQKMSKLRRQFNLEHGIGNEQWIAAVVSADEFKRISDENGLDSVYKMTQFYNVGASSIDIMIRKFGLMDLYYHAESSLETEIKDFLDTISIKYEKTKKIISPLELDIYCPDYKIAIEMNGDYWHSDLYKDKKYHFEKSKMCEDKGIRLIHIYEHEWNDPKSNEIIKSLLKSAFGKNQNTKIFARNCEVKQISNSMAKTFIDVNHIQSNRPAGVVLGLFHNDELVQIMSFTYMKTHGWWEIIRECTKMNYTIVGGISKLFKYFINHYNPDQIFSYCDFNKFDGKGYQVLGMKFIGYTGPDMKWLMKDGTVANRTPSRNAEMKNNSIAQIWGAGSKKYLWTKPE